MANKDQSPPIQTRSDFRGNQHGYLQQFKQKFLQDNPGLKNCQQFYVIHPNVKLLLVYLFFAFAKDNVYEFKKNKQKFSKISKQKLELCIKKFRLEWDTKSSLIEQIQKNQNKLASNKQLLLQATQKLDINDLNIMLRSAFNELKCPLSVFSSNKGHTQQIYKVSDPKIYIRIIISEKEDSAAIAFYQNGKKSQEVKQFDQPQNRKSSKNQNKGSSIQEQIPMPKASENERKSGNLRKSKSEGYKENIDNTQTAELESNGVTWFETIVVVIMIAAILANSHKVFDSFLREYNETVGKYYLLDIGYKLIGFWNNIKDTYLPQL